MTSINKIKILSAHEAIKIAAGEVVERPINIIKEIVENSIDAGATKIVITIHQAGKLLIQINDNGTGMSPDDAKLSVETHATSKISSVDDLEAITTFGFRGEALASINSVSNLTITTKTQDAHTGTRFRWSFGTLIEESLQSHPTGTTIEIANLFDNIPARQKFLKKDETEWRAIVTMFQAFCFDYQAIHFQLYSEDKLHFNCPAVTKIMDRATQLFDFNLQDKMVNLSELGTTVCSVSGIISQATYYRYDRNQIFLFVNNRWVKNIDLTKAIMRGYAGLLPPQKFPAAIIFIQVPSDQVDVNIHPKKEEVKFLHPKKIETILINSIKATFESTVSQQIQPAQKPFTLDYSRPAQFDFLEKTKDVQAYPAFQKNSFDLFHREQKIVKEIETFDDQHTYFTPPASAAHAFESVLDDTRMQEDAVDLMQQNMIEDHFEVAIIGQYKKTYILCEKNNNLVFIDQHAAHERILYEQFKANFSDVATIQLIFPEFVKLAARDIIAITPHVLLLRNHGIVAEIFSDTQLMIQATPVHLKNQLLQETMQQIVSWIHEIDDNTDEARISHALNEKIHTKMACSAAVKAGDTLNQEQMQQLLKDLHKIEHRFSCPHGRPTCWILPLDDVEKKFKRDYGKKAEQFYDFL